MGRLNTDGSRLIYHYDFETLWIEPWGRDSLRVRATYQAHMPEERWALLEEPEALEPEIHITEEKAVIRNGNIRAEILSYGKVSFYNQRNELLLEEYVRDVKEPAIEICSSLGISAREFQGTAGGDYEITLRFESNPEEKLFGMGQYQQPIFNLKGCSLELAQRNSQASVPFALSSLGYGFLWNNPAIGTVVFGKNLTSWHVHSSKVIDYWITAGGSPAVIEEAYAKATGTVPMMPEYAMGFWQCKLRYQTQEELLNVAREYKRRGIPLSVIVIDYFHWPKQGAWRFDPTYWPDPDAMVRELKEMGIELMVSIWPTVDVESENYEEMLEKGYLIRTDRGLRFAMSFHGNVIHYDATNPEAREYVWGKVKQNYYDKGIRLFWLDEAEPEYSVHDFDRYRYHTGANLQVGNSYPVQYARGFYEGMEREGQGQILNLIRCAWAGSQRYGALVWSGDIYSSFSSLKNQIAAGLHMGLTGIPWWTTDIGGFHGGDITSDSFKELFIRWFEYGTFCPVMRLHGDRIPKQPMQGSTGGASCLSGADNEVWSYGEEVLAICKRYIAIRERLRPYIRLLMKEAHEKGTPVMRPLFYDFPQDQAAWDQTFLYMFGPDLLVAPVCESGCTEREVYLPAGETFLNVWTGEEADGGRALSVSCETGRIPVFVRKNPSLLKDWKSIF